MSSPNTRIDEIVDVTAAIAMEEVEGVVATRGCGSGLVDHPTLVGQKILAAESNPLEDFTHWSDLPDMAAMNLQAMQGTHVMAWAIPMKLFIGKNDLARVRSALSPFMARYVAAFTNNLTLRGLVQQIARIEFQLQSDETWAWLAIRLHVTERLHLATRA